MHRLIIHYSCCCEIFKRRGNIILLHENKLTTRLGAGTSQSILIAPFIVGGICQSWRLEQKGPTSGRFSCESVPSWAPEGIRGTFLLLSFPSTPHSVPSEGDKNSAWAVNVWSVMWTLTIPSLQMEEAKQGVVVRHRQQIKRKCQKLPRMLCTCFRRLYKATSQLNSKTNVRKKNLCSHFYLKD